jgi:predicted nuclease of predicted toxin-antitoxin system
MKLLIDMNLSPAWGNQLSEAGFEVLHWSVMNNPCAPDIEIFDFARENEYYL